MEADRSSLLVGDGALATLEAWLITKALLQQVRQLIHIRDEGFGLLPGGHAAMRLSKASKTYGRFPRAEHEVLSPLNMINWGSRFVQLTKME